MPSTTTIVFPFGRGSCPHANILVHSGILRDAILETTKRVFVVFDLRLACPYCQRSGEILLQEIQLHLLTYYAYSQTVCTETLGTERDRFLLDVTLVYFPLCGYDPIREFSYDRLVRMQAGWRCEASETAIQKSEFRVAAVGGTFDHLHNGHKILLTVASLAARHLLIGLTCEALLENKKFPASMQSYSERREVTLAFLRLVRRNLQAEIVPITDVYGPTLATPDIDAIVVSKETLTGAHCINSKRAEIGLSELRIICVNTLATKTDVLGEKGSLDTAVEDKISSGQIRRYLEEQK